jgi:hypothetical protein
MTENENSLIIGCKDGVVKIFNTEKDFETREAFLAFTPVSNKKGAVTQVQVHPENGALFVSSITGNFKLFRTKL